MKPLEKHQIQMIDAMKKAYARDRLFTLDIITQLFPVLCQYLPLADPRYNILGFIFEDIQNQVDAQNKNRDK